MSCEKRIVRMSIVLRLVSKTYSCWPNGPKQNLQGLVGATESYWRKWLKARGTPWEWMPDATPLGRTYVAVRRATGTDESNMWPAAALANIA